MAQQAANVRDAHRFDEVALRAWMDAHVPSLRPVQSIRVQQFVYVHARVSE
jgi:hypothetical protein